MMIFLVVAAALIVGAPVLAAVLVTVASHREDAAKSLAGRPPGPLAAAARRLLRANVGGGPPAMRDRLRVRELLPGGRPDWQLSQFDAAGPYPAGQQAARRSTPVPLPRQPVSGQYDGVHPDSALTTPQW